jgi:nitroreductase
MTTTPDPLPTAARESLDLLARRRSIPPLAMRPDPVSQSYLDAILEAGRWAPTHGRTEPWRFQVFQGQAQRELGEARVRAYLDAVPEGSRKPGQEDKIRRIHALVPATIALGAALGSTPAIPDREEHAAVACAAQNMMLAATALGLGSFWSTGALAYSLSMREYLGWNEDVDPMGFLFLGFPAKEWPEGKRKPLDDERVRYRG